MIKLSMHLITSKSEWDSFEVISVINNTRIKPETRLPYRMKIFTEFNWETWLRIINFTELNYIFELLSYKLSVEDL